MNYDAYLSFIGKFQSQIYRLLLNGNFQCEKLSLGNVKCENWRLFKMFEVDGPRSIPYCLYLAPLPPQTKLPEWEQFCASISVT